jgi:nucleotide-binding universal stress UspA family protein
MYERILVPTDDVESMGAAFDHAIEVASKRGATVHVLYAVDKRAFLTLDDSMKDDVEEQLTEQGDETVATAAERFRDAGVDVVTACRSGDPADVILDYVDEADVDLVVMGTRRSDYQQNMLGSVSRKVAGRATVPVLTVNVVDKAD